MSDDPAHILFPADAPSKPPEWFSAQRNAAEQRLSGQNTHDDAARVANTLFPSEAKVADSAADPSAGQDDDADAADKLFKDDAATFDAKPVQDFISGFAASAAADGDMDRAEALEAAGSALVADFKAAGSDAAELSAALDVVRERQADTITEIAPEKLQAEMATSLETLAAEGVTSADLNAARAFIRDMEIVAPGTIDSLARTGAGNDLRLVRAAIREARRRKY